MTKFNQWLNTYIEESNINLNDTFEINKNGTLNIISYGSIVERIKNTTKQEQDKIKDIIVNIDFLNGDILHFFRYLGQSVTRDI